MNPRLQERPTWEGHPVPFITASTDDAWGTAGGVVSFKETDVIRWSEAITRRLCAVCGQSLDYWIVFLGSEAEVKEGEFLNPGMHEECARDAIDLCPYLAGGEPGPLLLGEKIGMAVTRDYKPHTRSVQVGAAKQAKVHVKLASVKRVEWFDRVDPGKQSCDNTDQGGTRDATNS